jgi:hypothetical protein
MLSYAAVAMHGQETSVQKTLTAAAIAPPPLTVAYAAVEPGLSLAATEATSPAASSISTVPFLTGTEAGGKTDEKGSTYIPADSWIYPEVTRLYSMGFADTMWLGMRPYTRRSLLHILQASEDDILASSNEEAKQILAALLDDLDAEIPANDIRRGTVYGLESGYTRMMGIAGPSLRDSYHLGQTIVNDYGRPYEPGFNNVTGFSTVNERGRFSLYVRGEYQHAPAAPGYTLALANQLSYLDLGLPYVKPNAPQATIPYGPIAAQNPFRLVEATLSMHLLGHEISGGKSDAWMGPGLGAAMAWSNNAENIYSFRINRVEPLHIPLLSYFLGPVRYDFMYGSLKGHTDPNSPYVHSSMFSFRPTRNFEFGFQRTAIFGGEGHEVVTVHSFLRSFFDLGDTENDPQVKTNGTDPGARFSDFNFSWRLPFVRKYATLYLDSITHDDPTPGAAPRRASYRPGVELSQIPGLPKLEFRVEGVSTDAPVSRSTGGYFMYYEGFQPQGYTNKGFIMGDWIGRQAVGGQAFVTYHFSGNEWLQVEYLNKETPQDFIQYGNRQNSFKVSVEKRLMRDIELSGWVQYERWRAPIYLPGQQNDTTASLQLTYWPKLLSHRD